MRRPRISGPSLRSAATTVAQSELVEGVDFSGTNVQELGVDEPDIIKTDGNRIVVASYNRLIYFAYPKPHEDDDQLLSLAVARARWDGGSELANVEDIFVARDRFASPGLINRYLGLPLYFGGQLLLAWAAGSPSV